MLDVLPQYLDVLVPVLPEQSGQMLISWSLSFLKYLDKSTRRCPLSSLKRRKIVN
jgi:hypothetical protein